MSVTFQIQGERFNEETPEGFVNVSNARARELLDWLWFHQEANEECLAGALSAPELAARCRRRLWPIARNSDPGTESLQEVGARGAVVVTSGRSEGYFPMRVGQLLALAERAGPAGFIAYG